MPSRLTAETTLRLLRDASGILREGGEPADAVRRVGELLVPEAADRVTVYAMDNDGRLHPLGGAGQAVPRRAGAAGAPARRAEPDPPGNPSPALDTDHPAAVACRRSEPAFVVVEGGRQRVLSEAPPADVPIQRIAVPLVRTHETVGVLEFAVEPGVHPPFGPGDLLHVTMIGERISLALENLRLRREVEAARRAKSDFLAVMSHELRTPLTAVVGYADLLVAGIPGPVTERQTRQLERIKESAWELLELIDGILGYARYEGDGTELLVSLVQPERLVDEALAAVRTEVRDKGLTLSVDVAEDLPSVRTDREKAVQILRHLFSNAAKFTDDGEIAVRVSSALDWVSFAVSDTGPGLEKAEHELAFEPFWQGERAETRTKGGTGMGLSMARRLAELLSGEIRVESEVGRGSTFVLRLPRKGPHPTFP